MSAVRELTVEGALEFTADVYADERGFVASTFEQAGFSQGHGGPLFPVAQTIHSHSRRGVVRGMHYTAAPPGMSKYAYCARGEALYMVADVRVGSPTFRRWDTVRMDQRSFRSMYFPVGVANGFVALTDDTVIVYMISKAYVGEDERALSVFDPQLALPLPEGVDPILSERDRAAMTVAEALERGDLPDYRRCRELERDLGLPESEPRSV